LGVKIVPENVSSIAKSDIDGDVDNPVREKVISLARGDGLAAALKKNQITAGDAQEVADAFAGMVDLNALGTGDRIRVAYTVDESDGATAYPLRVSIYHDGAHQASIARADDNGFVRADEPSSIPDMVVADSD